MTNFYIKIDDREKKMIEHIRETHPKLDVRVEHLTLGDIHIINSDTNLPVYIFERKTIPDFSASIVDGRYHEQRARLIAYKNDNPTVSIGYIIEMTSEVDDKFFNIMTSSCVSCHLLEIKLFYSIRGIKDTCYFIERLVTKLDPNSTIVKTCPSTYNKSSCEKKDFLRNIILSIKSFGKKTYIKMQNAGFTSISKIRDEDREEELKKCVGNAKFNKLKEYFDHVW